MSVPFSNSLVKAGIAALTLTLAVGCSIAEPTANAKTNVRADTAVASSAATASEAAPKGPTISIDKGGPADTVRAFYRLLREKKFRDAIFLTNLRPAVEG